jgi:hypothetical protein
MHFRRITGLTYSIRNVYTDDGMLAGSVAAVNMPMVGTTIALSPRTVFVADAHDWEGDKTEYNPICIGAFDDPDSALADIERRAREAHGVVCDGHESLDGPAGISVFCDGSCTSRTA